MDGRRHDFAIVGGGLSGGLTALALRRARPELSLVLIEAGETPGGNHRWSWFARDLPEDGQALFSTMRVARWDAGHDVRFPGLSRHLADGYRSLASEDFAAALRRALPEGSIRTHARAAALDTGGVTLDSGERIAARCVIDCRGFVPSPHLTGGWQLFMGRHLRTAEPHGLAAPIIMDACVDQHGAYRFVYVLPLGANELFVEDTYYADAPLLDRRALSQRIDAYCAARGWHGDILGHETGVLPVITGGNFARATAEQRIPGVVLAGGRGLFGHPLTSYTLPQAAATALAIAQEAELPGEQLAAMIEARGAAHWRSTGFYRMLGSMLFGAGEAEQRWRIFARFYGLPEPLIIRFYAGRSTMADKARILIGKPPIPIGGAIRALALRGMPLCDRTGA